MSSPVSPRRLRFRAALLALVASLGAAWAGAEPRIEPVFPLQGEHTHGSTLVELPNGDLLAGWFQGSGERWADDVRILGARRKRGAQNWSEPFLLADVEDFPDCNPVLFLDPQGRLWLMWIAILANQWETSLIKYRISHDYLDTPGPPRWAWQDTLLVKAGDRTERGIQAGDAFAVSVERQVRDYAAFLAADPATAPLLPRWEERAARLVSLARGEDMRRPGRVQAVDGSSDAAELGYPYFRRMGWQTRNKPFFTRSGRMIVPLYSDGFSFSLMAFTDDGGETWGSSAPLVGAGNIQPAIAATRTGGLVAYMRDNGPPPKRLHVSRSDDDGLTWSPVRDSTLPNSGTSCDLVTLANGDWVLINNDTEEGRERLTVSWSADEGRTWTHRVLVHEPGTRSHYPALIVGADGRLHATFSHFAADGTKQIRYATFTEAWLRGLAP